MNIEDSYIHDIGMLVSQCDKVVANEWNQLSLVFDLSEGAIANNGFLYNDDKVRPFSARISSKPKELSDKIRDFQAKVAEQSGHRFKQLLIQMEKSSQRIKIDFEFDDSSRWSITPANLKSIRQSLRPSF